MRLIDVDTILGYVEVDAYNPSIEVDSLLGYVEWIGTASPIALTEDTKVNAVFGYVETTYYNPAQQIFNILGYVETDYYNPREMVSTVIGYVEWIGTASPIALTEDTKVNTIFAYAELIDNLPKPVLTNMMVFIF